MSHPRMAYHSLNSELKKRVNQKCEGQALGDPLDDVEAQDMNLYYNNSHIKQQGISYLE